MVEVEGVEEDAAWEAGMVGVEDVEDDVTPTEDSSGGPAVTPCRFEHVENGTMCLF